MSTTTITCDSLNEGYQYLINALQLAGKQSTGRQRGAIHELLDVELVLSDPRKSVLSLPIRNMSRRYAAGEFLCYIRGTNKKEDFEFYSKSWDKLANPDGTINSAYGYRMFHPVFDESTETRFHYALTQLLENSDTKNAIIMLRDDSDLHPAHQKDRCCTLCLCFNIRDGKLNCRTIMRSQDLWLGLPYDVFCFTRLMQIMLYNYNAACEDGKEVQLGTYTHQVLNLHLYERDWQKVQDYKLMALNTEQGYQFPEFTAKSERDMLTLLIWEEQVRTQPNTPIEVHAHTLRELKLDPWSETLGSYIINKIENRAPTEFDIEMFSRAEKEAKRSTCIDRQVGCVITTKEGDVIGQGHNTVINCNQNCHDKLQRVCNVKHGEVCAIESISPAMKDFAHTLYVTLYPCFSCMQAIEKTTIREVKVKGFSHKGAIGRVILYDPEFFPKEQ